jgi:hypothetical protein
MPHLNPEVNYSAALLFHCAFHPYLADSIGRHGMDLVRPWEASLGPAIDENDLMLNLPDAPRKC